MIARDPGINFRDEAAKCINVYGGRIWAFAKSRMDSEIDAENAVREIFRKVWKCSGGYRKSRMSESECFDLICRQWLFNHMDSIKHEPVEPLRIRRESSKK